MTRLLCVEWRFFTCHKGGNYPAAGGCPNALALPATDIPVRDGHTGHDLWAPPLHCSPNRPRFLGTPPPSPRPAPPATISASRRKTVASSTFWPLLSVLGASGSFSVLGLHRGTGTAQQAVGAMQMVQGASRRVVQLGVAASGQGCRYTSMRVAETSPRTESSPKLLLGREELEADVVCKLPADNQGQHSRGGGVSSHTPQRERQVAQQGRERCRGCCGGGWGRAKASRQVAAMADRPAQSSRRSQAG